MLVDDIFAVVAEPTRRQILGELKNGDLAVGELVETLGVSQPTVSKHLKVLKDAGLVSMRAQGQKRFYTLEKSQLKPLRLWVDELMGVPARPAPARAARGAGAATTTATAHSAGAISSETPAATAEPVGKTAALSTTSDPGASSAGSQGSQDHETPTTSEPAALQRQLRQGPVSGQSESGHATWATTSAEMQNAGQQLGRAASRAATRAAEVFANLPKLGRKR